MPTAENIPNEGSKGLDQLRSLLLEEDRQSLQRVRELVLDRELFAEHLAPHIDLKLEELKANFPKEYESLIGRMIQRHLEHSQDKIIDSLYPVLGKMIKKYIEFQFQVLRESIEARIAATKQSLNFWQKIKNNFKGVTEAEMYMADAKMPKVEEIYLIERGSGLVLAHAAIAENLDADAVAGMLTAIKAFMEDAFRKKGEEVDLIQYADYKILVENQHSYYIAALLKGNFATRDRLLLLKKLENFLIKTNQNEKNRLHSDRESLSAALFSEFLEHTS